MPRTPEGLSEGTRVSDFITLGVLTTVIPQRLVHRVLQEEGRQSERIRKLPAHVMVYYVIALAIYMNVSYGEVLRCLIEGLEWLGHAATSLGRTRKSAISLARTRLGFEPLRRLYWEVVQPVATEATRGAWYRAADDSNRRWRLVSLDGSTLDVKDDPANAEMFGRPSSSRGRSGYPKLRFVALAECGTHVLFGASEGPYSFSEAHLAREVLPQLSRGMLCMADRYFYGFDLWQEAAATGADLLWRVKTNLVLPCLDVLADGSYVSKIYPSAADRKRDQAGVLVRVVEYEVRDEHGNVVSSSGAKRYRLITTMREAGAAPAEDLARLYHERWEIENAFDEFKTHLRGPGIVLRSRTPELVRQEFYGLLLAHYAVRGLMHEAARKADLDPDELSFVHAVRVIRRKITTHGAQLREGSTSDGDPFPPSSHCGAS